jgi:hypothetical protein
MTRILAAFCLGLSIHDAAARWTADVFIQSFTRGSALTQKPRVFAAQLP